jgi:hypothetical protein
MARRASSDQAVLERFQRQGRGRPAPGVEPEAMANYLSAILQGMMVQARSGASPEEMQRLVETTLAIWPGK